MTNLQAKRSAGETRAEPPRGVVPPESGAIGTCPACEGPLYGWIEAPAADPRRDQVYVLDRCERCGLGLLHEGTPGVEELIAASPHREDGLVEVSVPNKRSLQASVAAGQWAALRLPETPFFATPRAITELVQRSGRQVISLRQPVFGVNQILMWQTLMNGLTLHRDFLREVRAGRLTSSTARSRLAFGIDMVVSALAAPLVALVAFPAETVAALLRHGGCLVATTTAQTSSNTDSASSEAPS